MGMVRGQEYRLEASDTVDALLDAGFLQWIQPEPAEEAVVLTETVKKRKPKAAPKPIQDVDYLSEWELDGGFVTFEEDGNGAAGEPEASA